MNRTTIVSRTVRALALAGVAAIALAAVNAVPTASAGPARAAATGSSAGFVDPSVPAASQALMHVADDFAPAAPTF